ncbi:MAG: hypothetical protein ACD_20C00183G0006 [uncultured bacterium]|nr:MAG: hypothetical protein ACD_20C00183G0006 [uncultured bacterium]
MIDKLQNYAVRAAAYNMKNPSAFIKYTGAGANIFYYALQASAFAMSSSIPEKEKKFIVAQEVGEGIISTGIIIFLASKFEKFGEKLVDKAKILPEFLPKNLRNQESVKKILTSSTEHTAKLKEFKGLIGIASGLAGIVLAYTVATPYLRNQFANFFNKEKAGSDKQQTPQLQVDQNIFKDFINTKKL